MIIISKYLSRISEILKTFKGKLIVLAAVIAILIPFFSGTYYTSIFVIAFIYAIAGGGYDLLFGCAGQINLGLAAPFGIGGILTGWLTWVYNLSPWLSLAVGMVVAAIVNLAVAIPALKVKGVYLMIVTFAFCEICMEIFIIAFGEEGISPATLTYFLHTPSHNGTLVTGVVQNYFVSLVLMVFCISCLFAISKSSLGLKFRTVREDELLAQSLGINIAKYKIYAFLISTLFVGLAGGYYALYLGSVEPATFAVDNSFMMMMIPTLGGFGSMIGSIPGSLIISFAYLSLFGFAGDFRLILYGITLIAIIVFLPNGILGIKKKG